MGGPADRCGLAGRIGRVWDWDGTFAKEGSGRFGDMGDGTVRGVITAAFDDIHIHTYYTYIHTFHDFSIWG